jgi:hypothetical protein
MAWRMGLSNFDGQSAMTGDTGEGRTCNCARGRTTVVRGLWSMR